MIEEEARDVNNQNVVDSGAKSENQSQEQVQKTHESQEPAEGSKEYNFARLREKADLADRKNAELERKIIELTQAFEKKNAPVEEDELSQLAPDDILTVDQATKLSEKQARKIVQEMLKQQEVASLPSKARSQFNDFDSIVTEENIKKLEMDEPGLAAACANAPNPWEATYKILKKFVTPQQEVKANKGDMKMKENMSMPVSSNSIGRNSPLSNANTWSEASREDLYKEMMQAARKG